MLRRVLGELDDSRRPAARVLEQHRREARPAHEIAVLEDVVEDLAERGFTLPRALTSLPMPTLPPLASWSGGKRQCTSAFWHPLPPGIHLDAIDSVLKSWRLR